MKASDSARHLLLNLDLENKFENCVKDLLADKVACGASPLWIYLSLCILFISRRQNPHR